MQVKLVRISFLSWLMPIDIQLFTAVQWDSEFRGAQEREAILSQTTHT